jgi:hypothetical protein
VFFGAICFINHFATKEAAEWVECMGEYLITLIAAHAFNPRECARWRRNHDGEVGYFSPLSLRELLQVGFSEIFT